MEQLINYYKKNCGVFPKIQKRTKLIFRMIGIFTIIMYFSMIVSIFFVSTEIVSSLQKYIDNKEIIQPQKEMYEQNNQIEYKTITIPKLKFNSNNLCLFELTIMVMIVILILLSYNYMLNDLKYTLSDGERKRNIIIIKDYIVKFINKLFRVNEFIQMRDKIIENDICSINKYLKDNNLEIQKVIDQLKYTISIKHNKKKPFANYLLSVMPVIITIPLTIMYSYQNNITDILSLTFVIILFLILFYIVIATITNGLKGAWFFIFPDTLHELTNLLQLLNIIDLRP